MKKVLLSIAAVATIAMTSCGGNEMCECVEMSKEMMKEYKDAGGDADKLSAIEEKYKSEIEACEKAGEAYEKSIADLSDEEKEAKEKEMMDSCPAYKEMQEEMGM